MSEFDTEENIRKTLDKQFQKRFVLHPGEEKSKKDGQIHFIGAQQLADLYGVHLLNCYVVDYKRPETYRGIDFSDKSKLIHLYPQYHYEEYKKMKDKIHQLALKEEV